MSHRLRWRPRRWGHWTLRSRLVLVIAAVAGVALIGANFAGLVLLRSYLNDRIDKQLTSMSRPFAAGLRPDFAQPTGSGRAAAAGQPSGAAPAANGQPSGTGPATSGQPSGTGPATSGQEPGTAGQGTSGEQPGSGRNRATRLGPDQVLYVYGRDGTLDPYHSSVVDDTRPAPDTFAAASARARTGRPYTVLARDDASDWRLFATAGPGGGVMVAGASLAEVEQTGDRLLVIDAAVTVLMLVLLGLVAAFVVRLGLRPLTRMEQLAAEVSAGDLSRRLGDADPHTEPGRLGVALNRMLARIEAEVSARTASEQRLRQFVADASHELRTPLTSIRGFAELYRRGGVPPGPVLDETMSRIEGEAGRMGVLVEDLLLLARLDLQRAPDRRPVDLLEIAADTIRDAHARAPGRPVRLAGLRDDAETFEPPTVLGDEHGLRQVATNLVANALQHTPEQARITVRVGWQAAGQPPPGGDVVRSGPASPLAPGPLAVLEVSDDGPGVPREHAPRIFERLYRADPSRTRSRGGAASGGPSSGRGGAAGRGASSGRGGGSGLGLAIVAAIVQAHGGWVELDHPGGGGARFRVLLPPGVAAVRADAGGPA